MFYNMKSLEVFEKHANNNWEIDHYIESCPCS